MRYLTDSLNHNDEAGYTIEDGIVVDSTEQWKPNTRVFGDFTRAVPPTKADLAAEEAAWASRSGPCITIQKGTTR